MNILKKVNSLVGQTDLTFSPSESIDKIASALGNKFSGLLDVTFSERFQNKENSILGLHEKDDLIKRYTTYNMAIAVASAAAPGPLGILSSAGEMVSITGNHMKMIYDLGCCYGKESILNKDLLMDIPLQAAQGSTQLNDWQEQMDQLQESPIEHLQEKSFAYAQIIANKNLKKSLIKFIPVAGPVLMSVWTKKSTRKIAKVAELFFDSNTSLPKPVSHLSFDVQEETEILIERIKILATLMEQNGLIKEEELAFLIPIIKNAPLEKTVKDYLMTEAKHIGSHFSINYELLKKHPDTVDDIMTEMVVLANRDGEVDANEFAYMKEVTCLLGEPETELLELLNA